MSAHEMIRSGFDPKKFMSALTIFAREVGGEGLKRVVVVSAGDVVYQGPLIHDPLPLGRSTRVLTAAVFGALRAEGLVDDESPIVDELRPDEMMLGTSSYSAVGGLDSLTPFLRGAGEPDAESGWNRLAFEMTLRSKRALADWLREKIPAAQDWHQFTWNHFGLVEGTRINGGAGNHLQGASLTPFEWVTFGWFAHESFLGSEWREWTSWMQKSMNKGYGWLQISGAFAVADPAYSFLVVSPNDGFTIARLGEIPDLSSVGRLVEGIRSSIVCDQHGE